MRTKMTPTCPKCKSKKVLPIVYGLPDKNLAREAEQGKVVLGGCCIGDDDPRWSCGDCGNEWRYKSS